MPHWLFISGVQPVIPENTMLERPISKRPKHAAGLLKETAAKPGGGGAAAVEAGAAAAHVPVTGALPGIRTEVRKGALQGPGTGALPWGG